MNSFSSLEATVYPTKSDFTRRMRVGDIQNRKLRIVCGQCNGGWMSDLQQRAKPLLLSLIHGEATALDADSQKIVAGWIAMTVTVAEYFGRKENITITASDRQHIRRTQTPPSRWKIWIGHYTRGNWKPHLVHNTFPISSSKHRIKRNELGSPRPNTQTTAFTVSQLYIFAASSVTDIFEEWRFSTIAGAAKLRQIWPLSRNIVAWPGPTLTDREADAIAGSFFNFAEAVGRKINAPAI